MPLKVEILRREPTGNVVMLEGSLDSNTYQQFEKATEPLMTSGTSLIVLDLAKLSYVSSAGLRVIFRIWKNAAAAKYKFGMVNLQPQVKTVFDILQALPKEGVFSSLEELDTYLDLIQKQEAGKQKKAT